LQAIERLQYRPNGIASSLRAQRSHTVGVVIPTITNPFFPEFVRGAEDAANLKGYSVFLCNADENSEKEIQYLWLLQRHRVAGILVSSVSGPAGSETTAETDWIETLATRATSVMVTLGSERTGRMNVHIEFRLSRQSELSRRLERSPK
jgi:DNA-binding LacI/PurR family transcriptional regulator